MPPLLRVLGARFGDYRDWAAIERWATTIADLDVRIAKAPKTKKLMIAPTWIIANQNPTVNTDQSPIVSLATRVALIAHPQQ